MMKLSAVLAKVDSVEAVLGHRLQQIVCLADLPVVGRHGWPHWPCDGMFPVQYFQDHDLLDVPEFLQLLQKSPNEPHERYCCPLC